MEEKMYSYKYPHPAVATDCVIFGFDGMKLKILLIQRGIDPFKEIWAFPGGFLKMDESAEEGAMRELKEETNMTATYLEQFHCFSSPNRDPRERVISIAFLALVKTEEVKGGDDAAKAQWFSMDEIPQLAFDHESILRMAMSKLRERIHFQPIGFDLLLYEAILGVHFDRRNFAKKMLHLDILTQLDETVWPTPKRKAFLFSFNEDKYKELKQKGFRLEF